MDTNIVRTLLAKIGERVVRGLIPAAVGSYDIKTKQKIFTIPDEPRKLVVDPDGALNWFDAVNGPEC